jgi:protein SCO1
MRGVRARARVAAGGHTRGAVAVGITAVIVAMMALVAYLIGAAHKASGPSNLESFGTAPAYVLTDQRGDLFDSSALRGKIQVVSFLFPYCTTYCPITARLLAQTGQLVDQAGLRREVAFVAFNVDPQRAGPPELSAFLRQEVVDPDNPAWHYLTGQPDQIRRVVTNGFHVFYQKVSIAEEKKAEEEQKREGVFTPQPSAPNALADRARVDYDVVHNDVIEIVDGRGVIRAIFDNAATINPRKILDAIEESHR